MQGTFSKSGCQLQINGLHVFDRFVKSPVNDYSKWPLLWVSGSRSEKENNGSFKGAYPIKLHCGYKDIASLGSSNRMGPFQAYRKHYALRVFHLRCKPHDMPFLPDKILKCKFSHLQSMKFKRRLVPS